MNIDFDTWFKKNYQQGLTLTNRFDTVYIALNYLLDTPHACIVETGTMRLEDNWYDGKSTLIFGNYSKRYEGVTYSVDSSALAIENCKKATRSVSDCIQYTIADSVTFLHEFKGKIDLLYLDSMDCPEYDQANSADLIASQQHQRREIEAAFNKLGDKALVLLDDNDFANGGKTRLSKLFLQQNGFVELISWRQSLWAREPYAIQYNHQ